MDLKELARIVAAGESETVELKKSTAQLPRAGETLCGFLNGRGGLVVIGVPPNGEIVGQEVTDKTQQEIARTLDRFEPPAPVQTRVVALSGTQRSVVVLQAPCIADARPFTYDGRPHQRVGTTTSRMPQDRYESLLLERAHARRRWENQPAVSVHLGEALDVSHRELNMAREVDHIVGEAMQGEPRIVTIGGLVFFSTDGGDAWALDAEDRLALCLCRGGSRQPVSFREDDERLAIEWTCRYSIEGEDMTFVEERSGRVTSVTGYPTREIRQAVRRVVGGW